MRQDASSLLQEARGEASAGVVVDGETLAEEAIARRRGELAKIEQRAKAAEEKAQRYHQAEQRLAAEIKRHVAFLARIGSAEREAPDQIEAAEKLMAALSDAMIALHGFEHAPIPTAARRWVMAQQMSAQIADAIAAFLGPRVEETRHLPDQGNGCASTSANSCGSQPAIGNR